MDWFELGRETLLQHFAEEQKIEGAIVPPLFQNSLFCFESMDEFEDVYNNKPGGPPDHYSRFSNPSLRVVERKLAELEGTDTCKMLSSGMGAITMAVMSCIEQGSHVVALDTCYYPVRTLLADYLSNYGVTVTWVDGMCPESVIDAFRPETSLVYLESPSSLLFRLQDLETIAGEARRRGIKSIADNTYATPLYQNPAKYGIDIVCHSATKYLGGHSDVMAGALCCSHEHMERLVRKELGYFGSALSPFGAWLILRGMRTLSLRVQRHEQTANEVAAWLQDRPEVDRVHHLGLQSHPQRSLIQKQMKGSGGLFSFEPANQNRDWVRRFVDSLKLFQIGVSWGGFESLVVPLRCQPMNYPEERWIVRLFNGLEEPKDLIADLEQALAKAESGN
jgi:cystathionine beta-lyase/cystathionine gamma-synthase